MSRDRAADVLVDVVRSIDNADVSLIARSRTAWRCRAAEGFESHVGTHGARLGGVARELRASANRLFVEGDRLRVEARVLEAQADALDADSAAPGPV